MAQTQQVRASRKVRQARPAKMATEKQEQQRADQMEQAYEDWIDSMEPGNMYAEAEAERERQAEEAWDAQCEAECWAMEEAIRADREWEAEQSYQRHLLVLKIVCALLCVSAVLLAFGI